MRSIEDISTSICSFFVGLWVDETPISYPGLDFDPKDSETGEWVKLIITEGDSPPQRRTQNFIDMVILVQIYHKFGDNVFRVGNIADKARNIFHQRDITLADLGVLIRCRESKYVYHGEENKRRVEFDNFETATVRTEATVH